MSGMLSQSEIAELHVEQRFEIANQWLNAAEAVARKTRHPEAKSLVSYADSHVAVGVPTADGILDLYADTPDPDIDYFYLTPLLPIDAERLDKEDVRLEFLNDNPEAVARFREISRAVYLSPATVCRLGQGLILLHELQHVVRHPRDSAPTEDEHEVWLEEADVLSFEFDLFETLLGKAYQQDISRFIAQVLIAGELVDPAALETRLARKLGATDADMDFWLGFHAVNARWRFLEQQSNEPREAFATYLAEQNIIDHDSLA